MSDRFSKEDEEYIRTHFQDMTYNELASALNRKYYSIRDKIVSMGLSGTKSKARYGKDEIEYIIDNMDNLTIIQIADALHRSVSSVKRKLIEIEDGYCVYDTDDPWCLWFADEWTNVVRAFRKGA